MAAENGNLRIINATNSGLTATNSADFTFSVPSGGVGEILEATCRMKRTSIITGYTLLISEDCVINSMKVIKPGYSESVDLVDGTPNLLEFAGSGELPRLFTVVEQADMNSDIIINITNNDSVTVKISLTLYLAVRVKPRDIAAQPASR